MATSVSNQQINDYINSILQNPSLTDAQRASTINAAADGAFGGAVVATFKGNKIAVRPEPLLQAPGKVVVNFENVGNARVVELAKVGGVGVAGESTAGFAEGLGFIVTVGVNQTHPFAGHVVGVLPLLLGGVVAVVAVGMGDAHALGKSAGPG